MTKEMKKIVLSVIVALIAITANAGSAEISGC